MCVGVKRVERRQVDPSANPCSTRVCIRWNLFFQLLTWKRTRSVIHSYFLGAVTAPQHSAQLSMEIQLCCIYVLHFQNIWVTTLLITYNWARKLCQMWFTSLNDVHLAWFHCDLIYSDRLERWKQGWSMYWMFSPFFFFWQWIHAKWFWHATDISRLRYTHWAGYLISLLQAAGGLESLNTRGELFQNNIMIRVHVFFLNGGMNNERWKPWISIPL